SVTVNPVVATLFGTLLLGERVGWTLLLGLATVAAGIAVAATDPRRSAAPMPDAGVSPTSASPARLP
nr:hypothetical protein [Inquilinus sp.]